MTTTVTAKTAATPIKAWLFLNNGPSSGVKVMPCAAIVASADGPPSVCAVTPAALRRARRPSLTEVNWCLTRLCRGDPFGQDVCIEPQMVDGRDAAPIQ
jgi:hypothetical protein